MSNTFEHRIRAGRRFAYSQRIITLLVNFGTIAVLARLVPPAQFGLMAMITSVVNFLAVFRELGLTSATIQKASLSEDERGSLFFFNAMATGIISVLLALLAPLISQFYHEPPLESLILGASVGFLIVGVGAQHASVLRRNLAFREVFLAEVGGLVVGSAAAIILASLRHDAWALIVGGIVQAIVSTILFVSLDGWVPHWKGDIWKSLHLLAFGANVSLYSLLNYAANNVGAVLVGYLHGSIAMGFYARAQSLYSLPTSFLLHPYLQVQFPLMCRFSGDAQETRRLYLDIIRLTSLVFIPAGVVLPFVGVDFTTLLLGSRWAEAGNIFTWFSPAVVALGIVAPFGQYMISQGRLSELRFWGIGDLAIRGGGAVLGAQAGSAGAAAGFSFSTLLVAVPIIVWLCGRRGPVSASDQIRAAVPGIACAIAAGIAAAVAHLGLVHLSITDSLATLSVITGSSTVAWWAVVLMSRSARTCLLSILYPSALLQN